MNIATVKMGDFIFTKITITSEINKIMTKVLFITFISIYI